MTESRTCTTCGTALAAEWFEDRCARCSQTIHIQGIDLMVPPPRLFETESDTDALLSGIPQLEVLGVLGKGGMGVVYKARQKGLDRLVALKVLPADTQHDTGFEERFMREARALARLSHPNIVTVHDFGQIDGRWYFIMEYVDGVNLRQAMRTGSFNAGQVCEIIPSICDALQYAHDEGVVHRDIKPENILLDRRGRVKIADFGLARLHGDFQQTLRLTASGEVMGTLHYMAPEQVERPLEVDHRADIYAVGVMFYEMLTGELPIGRFRLPSEKVQTDPALDDIVIRALEKEPDRRYQHASDITTDIERVSSGRLQAGKAPLPISPVARRTTPPPLPNRRASVIEQVPPKLASVIPRSPAPWRAAANNATAAHALTDAESCLRRVMTRVQLTSYGLLGAGLIVLWVGIVFDILPVALPICIGFVAIGGGSLRVNRLAYDEFRQVARGDTSATQLRRNRINARRFRAGLVAIAGGALAIPIAGFETGGIIMIVGAIIAGQGGTYYLIREWMRRTVEPRPARAERQPRP